MRKIIIVGLLASLVACGSKTYYVNETPDTTEKETTTTTAVETTVPYVAEDNDYSGYFSYTEQAFIDEVYALYPNSVYVSDQELVDTARMTCSALQTGSTGDEVIELIMSSASYDPEIVAFLSSIVAAGVAWFCPDQAWKFS